MGSTNTESCKGIIGSDKMRLDEVIEELKRLSKEIDDILTYLLKIKRLIKELDVPELMEEQEKVKA